MVQTEERLTGRITFHVKPSLEERVDRVVESSPFDKPNWLRYWLEDALDRAETDTTVDEELTEVPSSDASLLLQLAEAKAQNAGQEEVIGLLRERLALADTQNDELHRRLEEAHKRLEGEQDTVRLVTDRALPVQVSGDAESASITG